MDNKIKTAYECLFVSELATAEETVSKFIGIVEKNGEIIDVTEWGKRRFEYPINDKNEGYYTIVTFRADPEFPAELERNFNITDGILRALVVKAGE